MKLKLIKDNEIVISQYVYDLYRKVSFQFNDIVTGFLTKKAVYQVYDNKDYCDIRVSLGNYQLSIKRFASDDQEYNRICAEELCELLNQEQ